jgi:hypothetical protein
MADVNGLLSDPRFQSLDTATQKAALGRVDSRFANLSDDDFNSFKQRIAPQGGPGSREGQAPNAQLKMPPAVPYGLQQGRGLSETIRNEPVAPPTYIGTTGAEIGRLPATAIDMNRPARALTGANLDPDSISQGALTASDPANSFGTRLGGAAQAAAPLTSAAAMLAGNAIAGRTTAPRPVDPVNPIPPAPGISAAQPTSSAGTLRPLPIPLRAISKVVPGGRTAANTYDALREGQAQAATPSAPIPQPQGSTAIPAQFGRSLPPRAIPPGGPQTGTVPGAVEPPPSPPPAPQGSTAIPGQYGRNMPPQFPPKQTPIGSLPLNPPGAPPIVKGATPVNPPTPPQSPTAPTPESAPQAANLIDPAKTPGVIDYRAQQAAKVAAAQPELQARIQSGTVNPDDLTSHPDWKPNPPGKNWQQLMKDLNLGKVGRRAEGSGQINTAEATLNAMGLKWAPKPAAQAATASGPPTMPQPVQQAQAGPAAARMSPPNIIRAVANAVPKEGIGIGELRENLPQLSKGELDQAVMDLYRSNKIDLDAHDFPQGMSQPDLDRYTVPDGKGNYYIMAGRR